MRLCGAFPSFMDLPYHYLSETLGDSRTSALKINPKSTEIHIPFPHLRSPHLLTILNAIGICTLLHCITYLHNPFLPPYQELVFLLKTSLPLAYGNRFPHCIENSLRGDERSPGLPSGALAPALVSALAYMVALRSEFAFGFLPFFINISSS